MWNSFIGNFVKCYSTFHCRITRKAWIYSLILVALLNAAELWVVDQDHCSNPCGQSNSKMALGTRLIETHTQTHRNTYSDKYINVVIYLRRSVRREFLRTFSLSTFMEWSLFMAGSCGTEEKRYIFAAFSVRTIRSCCFDIALTYLV